MLMSVLYGSDGYLRQLVSVIVIGVKSIIYQGIKPDVRVTLHVYFSFIPGII